MNATATFPAEQITRILFQDFPGWMLVSFYIAAIATIAAFVFGCYTQVRKYRRGQAIAIGDLKTGLIDMVTAVLTQPHPQAAR